MMWLLCEVLVRVFSAGANKLNKLRMYVVLHTDILSAHVHIPLFMFITITAFFACRGGGEVMGEWRETIMVR